MQNSRRDFLKKASAVCAVPYFPQCQAAFANTSPNDRPRLGCIGAGWIFTDYDGPQHRQFADILAVCDVDSRHADRAKNHPKIGAGKADSYRDYRKILERNDIDVVCIATVDHWHVKIAIEALQAGKHVFCQKPLTLTLEENQLIRNACKKFSDRVFIVATQQRSDLSRFARAVNMVQKGILGKITTITAGLRAGVAGGPFPKAAPPKELDWNMWLGQTPACDYIEKRCHMDFRWWYEYSGGKFTDWGAHHIDIATWAIEQDKQGLGPVEIDGTAAKHPVPFKDGYPTVADCFNTSHDFTVTVRYADGPTMIVDSRSRLGILFEGEKGRIFVSRDKIIGKPIEEEWDKDQYTPDDMTHLYHGYRADVDLHDFYADVTSGKVSRLDGDEMMVRHKANFYRCIRDGGQPISDVFSHVQTMNTCHLCAIAARLGRVIRWDPRAEKITGDEQAAAFFSRRPRPGFEIPKI